jgi:hypothetical protein
MPAVAFEWIEYRKRLQAPELRMAVKSMFLNALAREALFSCNVTRETCTVAEVVYENDPQFVPRLDNGVTGAANMIEFVARTNERLAKVETLSEAPAPIRMHHHFCGLGTTLTAIRLVVCDTPGANDVDKHIGDIALAQLKQADCIVYLMNSESLGNTDDERLLGKVVKARLDIVREPRLRVVLTKMDKNPAVVPGCGDMVDIHAVSARNYLSAVVVGKQKVMGWIRSDRERKKKEKIK